MSDTDKEQHSGAARAAHANGNERIIHRLRDPAPADSPQQLDPKLALPQARYRHLDV
jgi:hypothetical protein